MILEIMPISYSKLKNDSKQSLVGEWEKNEEKNIKNVKREMKLN